MLMTLTMGWKSVAFLDSYQRCLIRSTFQCCKHDRNWLGGSSPAHSSSTISFDFEQWKFCGYMRGISSSRNRLTNLGKRGMQVKTQEIFGMLGPFITERPSVFPGPHYLIVCFWARIFRQDSNLAIPKSGVWQAQSKNLRLRLNQSDHHGEAHSERVEGRSGTLTTFVHA